jgi:hypothetical protein
MLGPLQYASWPRHSFARERAELSLYLYRAPVKARSDMPFVKKTEADDAGNFDFGSLHEGHYTLIVDDLNWGSANWFDVEINSLPRRTESVTVDISPNFPDCQGGHEFIIKSK